MQYDAFLWTAWKRAEMLGILPFSRKINLPRGSKINGGWVRKMGRIPNAFN